MALKLRLETQQGVILTYHRISRLEVEYGHCEAEKQITVTVRSDIDQAARVVGKLPTLAIPPLLFTAVGRMADSTLAPLYQHLKTLPRFAGAEDC